MNQDQPARGHPINPAELHVRHELTAALERAIAGEPEPRTPARSEPQLSSRATEGPDAPKERPITFNAAMVRALLAGHKTQTRRPIRPLPVGQLERHGYPWPADATGQPSECRLARVGDVLWVREPWAATRHGRYTYEADLGPAAAKQRQWRPGRFLAKHASRIRLVVTRIVPERLADITPRDATLEGMPPGLFSDEDTNAPVVWFHRLWDSIYGRTEFASANNPWVWAIRFRIRTLDDERLHGSRPSSSGPR